MSNIFLIASTVYALWWLTCLPLLSLNRTAHSSQEALATSSPLATPVSAGTDSHSSYLRTGNCVDEIEKACKKKRNCSAPQIYALLCHNSAVFCNFTMLFIALFPKGICSLLGNRCTAVLTHMQADDFMLERGSIHL